ncbi:hypothetical protein ILUMI_19924, partial [Ignelater luminosus]
VNQNQIFQHPHQMVFYATTESLLKSNINPQHELAAQILLTAIKQARSNSGFGLLNRNSQDGILTYLWAPLFLLKAAHWPSVNLNMLPNLQNTFKKIKDLKLDYLELEIFENILLCRGDLIGDSGQASLADDVQERALQTLTVHTVSNRGRLEKLLTAIPMLFTPSSGALCAILFRPIIGPIPIETVILTI